MTDRPGKRVERTARLTGRSGRRSRRRLPVRGRERWRAWIPYLVLGTGLVVTVFAAALVHRQVVEDDRVRFQQTTGLLVAALEDRLGEYEDALRAMSGLHAVFDEMGAEEFDDFVSYLSIEHHPGLRALAYVEMVPSYGRKAFERKRRAEGFEGFSIWPASDRPWHLVATYLAPLSGSNRAALGYDLSTSEARLRALLRACATGTPTITGPVEFATAPTEEARRGLLVAMPIYADDAEPVCENLRGYMIAALERAAFFESVLDVLPSGQLHFAIRDASDDEAVLHRTAAGEGVSGDARLRERSAFIVGGRRWVAETWPGPAFHELSPRYLVHFVLITGVVISLALFALVWSESRARGRAEQVAQELYRSEEALTRANQAKDEFLAMLGHELRNPLSALKMALDILRSCHIDDPDARAALDVATRQMRHQTRLVDDLLDVSRVSRGKIVLKPERLDLRDVVADAVVGIQSSEVGNRHGFTVSRPAEPILVDGDPTRLEQVVANLLSNAVKYSPEEAHVQVSVDREGDEAVVRVRDRGLGLDPTALDRIFDLFAQENTSLDRAAGGLGIGLTLVKRLVEMHGGAVAARSEGRGKGSEFEVRLPIAEGTPPPPAPPNESEEGTRLRILLVEDNEDARLMMRSLLEKQGHRVQTASDGESGVQAALEDPPDVALIDIGLPAMDGYDVARRLRGEWGSASPLLIAVTGYGQPSDRQRSGEAGFDHHLVKPVDPDRLQELLAGARARRPPVAPSPA
ncbi:MAG: CHASE domain-containing protein [Myxococcota bacterium]